MLTLRADKETMKMKAYLKQHKVRWQTEARELIRNLLFEKCKEFKMKQAKVDLPF